MGRLDTQRRRPPVRIALAAAANQQAQMLPPQLIHTSKGAGNFGQRERRFASVPIRLKIQSNAGPNTPAAREAALAMGVTRRKRGYPPITTLPTAS